MSDEIHLKKNEAIEKELEAKPGEISIIRLVDALINQAFNSQASDIHINPEEDRVRARLRIDGVLHDAFIFPKEIQSEIITRIKVLSGLRTDEHQAAQDGRFKIPVENVGYVDVRVSIAPTYYGENAVLRILSERTQLTLDQLGYSERDLKVIKDAIKKPYGMILATGPTGSGKTTSLYSIIKNLNTPEISIITIEDPIEYSIKGIEQIQVNPQTGLTFAHGLRSILRQDPNVIMVGEIRDEETAGIAVNAALTGHLLLSTIHTNDAATTLPRLLDMNIEPFLIASTINIAIGQRLVRKICSKCKIKKVLSDAEFKSLSEVLKHEMLKNNRDFFEGKGCVECEDGYEGRVGIYEVLEVTEPIRELIMKRANSGVIREAAIKEGMTAMLEDGFKKALVGITTIEEVLRIIHE
ncbi:MAG: Type II secretion system protein E [Candidatus Curtissbacteria bacterium GW2011_GWA1_40_24]|uniref:Type II secretion system protein E n=2 Tax=Patescibacteria group TaxID=1783273 RepID=A0A0G0S0E9_9BACT|nr:MAG: Type II secretion system protein E [Candidatus Curtissbacteria bacterium GW2011_GWA1_40_24]KKR89046.1 MAG: Type II secretion system protein E [Candidatus Wolfebacteria bacterium GW2011_GWB1_41_12]